MSDRRWVEQVKAAVDCAAAARVLGLQPGRGRSGAGTFGPCPIAKCGRETRGSTDKRPPLWLPRGAERWKCLACGGGGDVVDLVAAARVGVTCDGLDQPGWTTVREACTAIGWAHPIEDRKLPPHTVSGGGIRKVGSPVRGRPTTAPNREAGENDEPVMTDAEVYQLHDDCVAFLRGEDPAAEPVRDYLRNVRGFSERTIDDWQFGACSVDGRMWLVLPLKDRTGAVANLRRRVIPQPCAARPDRPAGCGSCDACRADDKAIGKYRVITGRPLPLFGSHRLARGAAIRDANVIVTEGELDVVAAYEYGWKENVVSGTAGADVFTDEWLDELEPFPWFVIATDNDAKGDDGAAKLVEKLGRYRCARARLPCKDLGECLATGVDVEVIEAAFVQNATPSMQTEIVLVGDMEDEVEASFLHRDQLVGRPTPIGRINRVLGGIRPGLIIVTGDTGSGKALRTDEPVLTPEGWRPIGAVKVGDRVIGSAGTPVVVKGVFPQGVKDICAVTFSDGACVRCDWDHLWSVNTDLRVSRGRGYRAKTARELSGSIADSSGRLKWRIPIVAPVAGARHREFVDPYILGVLIGDGSLTGSSLAFTKGDPQIHEIVRALLPTGYRLSSKPEKSGAIRSVISTVGEARGRIGCNEFLNEIRRYGLNTKSIDKFIPPVMLRGSIEQRFALLQGLLDTDGGVEANVIHYGTSSERLANDVITLVRSLGGIATVSSEIPTYRYKGELKAGQRAYDVRVYLPEPFRSSAFRLDRKRGRLEPARSGPARRIVSIEPDGSAECVCIAVDAPDRLYVTRDYVLTHNTTFLTWLLTEQARAGYPTLITAFEQAPVPSSTKVFRTQIGGDPLSFSREERRPAWEALRAIPLYQLKRRGNMAFSDVEEHVKYAVRRLGVKNVLIDHLGFVTDPDTEDERREIERVVRPLSILAEHEGATVFLVCHPNNSNVIQKRRVMMGDLKGASSIRQDAHEVWVVQRLLPTEKRTWPATMLHFDKVRSDYGESGSSVLIAFDPLSVCYAESWSETPSGKRGVVMPSPAANRKPAPAPRSTRGTGRARASRSAKPDDAGRTDPDPGADDGPDDHADP